MSYISYVLQDINKNIIMKNLKLSNIYVNRVGFISEVKSTIPSELIVEIQQEYYIKWEATTNGNEIADGKKGDFLRQTLNLFAVSTEFALIFEGYSFEEIQSIAITYNDSMEGGDRIESQKIYDELFKQFETIPQ